VAAQRREIGALMPHEWQGCLWLFGIRMPFLAIFLLRNEWPLGPRFFLLLASDDMPNLLLD
jgi:hypothetical protein